MPFKMFVDATGVPYSDYGVYHGLAIGRQRSVLSVAERGLCYLNRFGLLKGPEVLLSYNWSRYPNNKDFEPADVDTARRMTLNCADWLMSNVESRGRYAVWTYPYPMSYGTKPGWCSAHAQAVGLQLLARAAKLTGDTRYLEPVASLLAAFEIDVDSGGLVYRDEGLWWFEKFADSGNMKPKVLNGTMFAVLGLIDVADSTSNQLAYSLFERGIEAVVTFLPRFDLGDWSAYDIHGRPASAKYHQIHIDQLLRLSRYTEESSLAIFLERFTQYQIAGRPGRYQ